MITKEAFIAQALTAVGKFLAKPAITGSKQIAEATKGIYQGAQAPGTMGKIWETVKGMTGSKEVGQGVGNILRSAGRLGTGIAVAGAAKNALTAKAPDTPLGPKNDQTIHGTSGTTRAALQQTSSALGPVG